MGPRWSLSSGSSKAIPGGGDDERWARRRGRRVKRREFVTLVGAAAAGWPLAAHAQSMERIRRIAMLSEFTEPQMQPLIAAFGQQMQQLGWKDGSFRIDLQVAIADAAQFEAAAAAIVGTAPDVVVALG